MKSLRRFENQLRLLARDTAKRSVNWDLLTSPDPADVREFERQLRAAHPDLYAGKPETSLLDNIDGKPDGAVRLALEAALEQTALTQTGKTVEQLRNERFPQPKPVTSPKKRRRK